MTMKWNLEYDMLLNEEVFGYEPLTFEEIGDVQPRADFMLIQKGKTETAKNWGLIQLILMWQEHKVTNKDKDSGPT